MSTIQRIEPLDMTSDEIATFYAVDWREKEGGQRHFEASAYAETRDNHAKAAVEAGFVDITTYEIVAPFSSTSLDDVYFFIRTERGEE
jgi:hypothetical protein